MAKPLLSFRVVGPAKVDFKDLLSEADMLGAGDIAVGLIKYRTVQQGKRSDGTDLLDGSYSDKGPIYIPVDGIGTGSPLMKPRGGKLSRTGRTMRFENGYKEARVKSGRTSEVNFTLSGNTFGKRFRVLRVNGLTVVVGWPAGSLQAAVARGLDELEKGRVAALSTAEAEILFDSIIDAIVKNLEAMGVPSTPEDLRRKIKLRAVKARTKKSRG